MNAIFNYCLHTFQYTQFSSEEEKCLKLTDARENDYLP